MKNTINCSTDSTTKEKMMKYDKSHYSALIRVNASILGGAMNSWSSSAPSPETLQALVDGIANGTITDTLLGDALGIRRLPENKFSSVTEEEAVV